MTTEQNSRIARRTQAETAIRRFSAMFNREVRLFNAYARRIDIETTNGERQSIDYDGNVIA